MKIWLLLIPLFISGCSSFGEIKPEPDIKVVTVEKPILYCPAPPDLQYPRLIIENLVPGDENDPGRVVQFWRATVKQLEGEIKKRDTLLDAYRGMQNNVFGFKPQETKVPEK